MRGIGSLTLLLIATVPGMAIEPAIWNQWRGPGRDGLVKGQDWPDKLSDSSWQKLWRVENLGPSYSGPIVSVDSVFITETVNKKTEVVRCLDRKTGQEKWKAEWEGSMTVPFFAARNGSWIRSTPALDGESLYVCGIRDVLVCLDARTGKQRWRLDFMQQEKSALPAFGAVCSPLVEGDAVYVQAGGGFCKVDKTTGKILWKVLEEKDGMMGSAFSSPVLCTIAGRKQIVVQTRTRLAGVDPDSGQIFWSREIPSFRGMNILTPTPVGDAVFTSTYGGNTRLLKLAYDDGTWNSQDAWMARYEGNMTSPVVIDNHAYLYGKDRRMICFNLQTGKECWRTEERFGEYWNMVASGNKILALDMNGNLYLIRANPNEFEKLDSRKVADAETWAHLAVCGEEIFIRDLNGITAYRWARK